MEPDHSLPARQELNNAPEDSLSIRLMKWMRRTRISIGMFLVLFGPSAFTGTANILDHYGIWDSWNTVDVQDINALQKRFEGGPVGVDMPQFLQRCGDLDVDAISLQRYLVFLDDPAELQAELGILRTNLAAAPGLDFVCADSTQWQIYDTVGGYYLASPVSPRG
jgi:hypothetical protein